MKINWLKVKLIVYAFCVGYTNIYAKNKKSKKELEKDITDYYEEQLIIKLAKLDD